VKATQTFSWERKLHDTFAPKFQDSFISGSKSATYGWVAKVLETSERKLPVTKILQGSVVAQTTLGGLTIHPPVANFL